jgi:hypothetical protein
VARGADPAGGTLDHEHPELTWSGSTTIGTFFLGGAGCRQQIDDPTCDTFLLTIPELSGAADAPAPSHKPLGSPGRGPRSSSGEPLPDDVLISLGTNAAVGAPAEYDLYVYDDAGNEVAHSVKASESDAVLLRDPAPGTYAVAVQTVLVPDPNTRYVATAKIVESDGLVGYDEESFCGVEDIAPAYDIAENNELYDVQVVGNPTVALDAPDAGDNIDLDVLVILDGVLPADADAVMRAAADSYAPLNITLRVAGYTEHSFAPLTDGFDINNAARTLLGGRRPGGVDIVEVLTNRDVVGSNDPVVLGVADCIGGVAHADRAFVTAEAYIQQNIDITGAAFGIPSGVHFDERLRADITAHEIGHLMGAQHHYANCAEGVSREDVLSDRGFVDASPCDLMFNEADFNSENFGVVNGRIVRASANRYARP